MFSTQHIWTDSKTGAEFYRIRVQGTEVRFKPVSGKQMITVMTK